MAAISIHIRRQKGSKYWGRILVLLHLSFSSFFFQRLPRQDITVSFAEQISINIWQFLSHPMWTGQTIEPLSMLQRCSCTLAKLLTNRKGPWTTSLSHDTSRETYPGEQQWELVRSAHISQIQSLRNSTQDVINIQDKMDRNVFIPKVGDKWVRFFMCWKLQAGVFTCRANTSIKIKQLDS